MTRAEKCKHSIAERSTHLGQVPLPSFSCPLWYIRLKAPEACGIPKGMQKNVQLFWFWIRMQRQVALRTIQCSRHCVDSWGGSLHLREPC